VEPGALQGADGLKCTEDSHDAVVFARILNRVDMRAGSDGRRSRIATLPTRERIADGVLPHGKTRSFAALDQPGTRAHVRRCEKDPCHRGWLRFRNQRELFNFGCQACGIDLQCRQILVHGSFGEYHP
jgi:hypothetical protein